MKVWSRRVAAAAAALLLTVCPVACTASHPDNTAQPVTSDFFCQASIHYREMEVVARLERRTDGTLVLTFALPQSLSGIALGWDGTDMTMEMGGMALSLPVEKVPESALIRCLLRVLADEHADGTVTEEGYVLSGEVEGMAYVLVCDPQTGMPLSLSVPEEELTATFTGGTRLTTEDTK